MLASVLSVRIRKACLRPLPLSRLYDPQRIALAERGKVVATELVLHIESGRLQQPLDLIPADDPHQ